MSLINDALKRAKEAQQQNPPSLPPEIPAHVTTPSSRSGAPAWLWLVIILLLVGFGAFLVGKSLSKRGETSSTKSVSSSETTVQPVTAPKTESKPTPVSSPPPVVTAANTTPPPATATVVETKVMAVAPQTTTAEAVLKSTAPVQPTMKLQSIIYDPQHPSVMINGKLLFVGDSFEDLRVQEIRRNGVTLVGIGVTNVLSLPEY